MGLAEVAENAAVMDSASNTLDVRPFLKLSDNSFLKVLRERKPEQYGRTLVRTMNEEQINHRIALLESQIKRLQNLGRKAKEAGEDAAFERLGGMCAVKKLEKQAIIDELGHRLAVGAAAADVRRQQVQVIEKRRRELWEESGISGNYSFEDLPEHAGYPNRHDVIAKAMKWVEQFPNVKRGVAIYGHTGTTKTCLAKAMAWALNQKAQPVSVLFVKCLQLGSILDAEKREKTSPTLMERAKAADVVVVDDIEKALAGIATLDAKKWIRELLDYLEDNHRIAIATSEFPLNPDPCYAESHKSGVAEYVHGRLASVFDWVELSGPNYRLENSSESENYWS